MTNSSPADESSLAGVDIVSTSVGVRFERCGEVLGARSWTDVVDLGVDGTVTSRRASFVRVAVLGWLGWLFPRRTDTSIVRVRTSDGTWVFGVDDLSTDESRGVLAQLAPYHR